jgi:hypothetical protein
MTQSLPFVIQAEAVISVRLLVFAEDYEAADAIALEQSEARFEALREKGGFAEDNEYVLYEAEARPASGGECLGTYALTPGLPEFEKCDHEDHEHGVDE